MSAAPKLLPDPLPLRVEGGCRFIGHPVNLVDFPFEHRPAVRDVWDAILAGNVEDTTILPARLTDRYTSQYTGRSPRSVQEGFYFAELGPDLCHVLAGIERRLRDAVRAGDADAAARARTELVEFRAARQDLKDRFRQAAARMVAIASKPEPTDTDLARLAELADERDRIRAELVAGGALILRHSGPGFGGYRNIEIVRRLAGAKSKAPRKPRADGKPTKEAPIPNVGYVRETTPEHAAAAIAVNERALAGDLPEPTAEDQAVSDRVWEESRRRREAADRKKPRPRIELDPAPRDPSAPASSAQTLLERKKKELGIQIVPEPDGTDPGTPPQPAGP